MKKKSEPTKRLLANLTYNNMKDALPKLDRIILKLENFDMQNIHTGQESSLHALSNQISQLITDIFGNESHEYHRYDPYSNLRDLALSPSTVHEIKQRTRDKIQNSIATLEAIKEDFSEKL